MYVHTYVVDYAQECHEECSYIHALYIGIDHIFITQSDTFRYAQLIVDCGRRHSLVMEMEVGDDSTARPSWLKR